MEGKGAIQLFNGINPKVWGLVATGHIFFGGIVECMSAAAILPKVSCFEINQPPLNAAEAIRQLAGQTGAKLLFSYDIAQSRHAQAVRGCFTMIRAMEIMLEGSGLEGVHSGEGVFLVVLKPPPVIKAAP